MSDSTSRKRSAPDNYDGYEDAPSSPASGPPSSLPPSSPPPRPFEEDDRELDNDIDDLDDLAEEAENEVDLFGDNMERDYRGLPEQDTYDVGEGDIDDEEYEALDAASRRKVDARLNRRDNALRARRGLPDAFLDEDDGEDAYRLPTQRRRRHQYDDMDTFMDGDNDEVNPLQEELTLESLADVKASSISEWITQPAVTRTIARELKSFILEFTDENGRSVYGGRIRTLGEVNSESLEVSYMHLVESKAILALFLSTCPAEMLKIFDVIAMEATELHYPDYSRIHSEVHVRITDLPTSLSLRDLREGHLNSLIKVSGVVTRRTGVFPQLKYVKFDCLKCGTVLGPFFQDSNTEVSVSFCHQCQSRGPFRLNTEKTVYRNYQRITLQEAPGTVAAGRIPRHREVILLWDLIDIAKPGEEIEITGIYKNTYDVGLNSKNGFPVFSTVIEANAVRRREGRSGEGFAWTEEDEREFRLMSKDKNIISKIIDSMAPSIYGHRDIKTAIACSLFGGVPKDVNGKLSIRGDINVLLLGDPGTAKSQVLKYVEKTAQRAVFATGQGASAVGLTASVRKDPITREWTLEGGALVLADKGTCIIDEFDKMNDQDRTSIHEAMEQQSISISKAGIVTSLQARCAIMAAANPNGGRYNSSIPLSQNVDLTEPILSRFDILCVVRDIVNPDDDERLAKFVVDSHTRSHPLGDQPEGEYAQDADEDMNTDTPTRPTNSVGPNTHKQTQLRKEREISPISQDVLVKYIAYARSKVSPKLHNMDTDKISRVYADLRRESKLTGSFPITVRHLESILRISEAFAKMRLSEFVNSSDIDKAITVSVESFIGTQKLSVKRSLKRSFMKYLIRK